MTFLFFNVIIRQLYISLTHKLKAKHYFKNTVKSLTETIIIKTKQHKPVFSIQQTLHLSNPFFSILKHQTNKC